MASHSKIAGRSQAGGIHTSPGGALLPGTIQEAVEEVNSLGGRGIAVACDLSVDEEIRSLFERVRQESGHLNILVNNACASPKFCPPVISTAYGVAIHRQSAIALAHDKRHLAPGGSDPAAASICVPTVAKQRQERSAWTPIADSTT
jgi:NAD(P)-dependent dehydrogenase (short-subunit alcohol dehydrogenase family)